MNIKDMTPREKSIKLLSLAGCNMEPISEAANGLTFQYATFMDGYWIRVGDENTLYDEDNMAMAWRVLNWAHACQLSGGAYLFYSPYSPSLTDEYLPPAKAIAKWLDKILQRAIDSGLME